MQGNIYAVFYDRIVVLVENKESFLKWIFRKVSTRTKYIFLTGDFVSRNEELKKFFGFQFCDWRADFIRELSEQKFKYDVFIVIPEFSIKDDYEWALKYYFNKGINFSSLQQRHQAEQLKEEWGFGWIERGIDFIVGYNPAIDRYIFQELRSSFRSFLLTSRIRFNQTLQDVIKNIIK